MRLQIQNRAARRINFHYRNRSVEISAETFHYRYRFSLEFQLISITDTDFGLKTNEFCNYFGYNGKIGGKRQKDKWFHSHACTLPGRRQTHQAPPSPTEHANGNSAALIEGRSLQHCFFLDWVTERREAQSRRKQNLTPTTVLKKMHTKVLTKVYQKMPIKVDIPCFNPPRRLQRKCSRECSQKICQCSRKCTLQPFCSLARKGGCSGYNSHLTTQMRHPTSLSGEATMRGAIACHYSVGAWWSVRHRTFIPVATHMSLPLPKDLCVLKPLSHSRSILPSLPIRCRFPRKTASNYDRDSELLSR